MVAVRGAALAVRVLLAVRKASAGTVAVEVVGVRAGVRSVGCEVVAVVAVAVVVVAVRVAWTGCVSGVAVVCICRICGVVASALVWVFVRHWWD